MGTNTGAFPGIRVVDASDRLSGAFAARMLGDLGAEVLLAEPAGGHALRHEAPFAGDHPDLDRSVLHSYANWNKQSVRVDSDDDLIELASAADVVVTTRNPSSGDALPSFAPGVVHLSITPHGLDSPLAGVPGNNLTACARTGWATINQCMGEAPLQLPERQTGYIAGLAGFAAVGAALFRRQRTGAGEVIDLAELDAMVLTVQPWALQSIYWGAPRSRGPYGRRYRSSSPPLWRAADGLINLGIGDWPNWAEAMETVGAPDLANHPEFAPVIGRNGRDLRPVIQAIDRSLPAFDRWSVFHRLAALRCVAGCVQNAADLLVDQQFAARDHLVDTTVDETAVRAPGAPTKMSPPAWSVRRPAPRSDEAVTVGAAVRAMARTDLGPDPRAECRTTPSTKNGGADLPLAGVRVLAFTQAWSGTLGTELLALLGADVVQIESFKRCDVWRSPGIGVPTGLPDDGCERNALNTQGLFNSVNLNKRGLALDMSTDEGRALFWRLVPQFDIVAENFTPHVLEAWGITLDRLAEHRPDIILASVSGYGLGGPLTDYSGNGAAIEPMSGLSSLHGYPGDEGMNTGGFYPDPLAAYTFAGSIIAALVRRQSIDGPQRIDLSMQEAVATLCGDAVIEHQVSGNIPGPAGNRHPRVAPHGVYPAADEQWVAIAATDEIAWQALCVRLGRPELAVDPRFATMAARKRNEDELDEIIGGLTTSHSAHDLEVDLGSSNVCAARVRLFLEPYREPDDALVARGQLQLVAHPEAGAHFVAGAPWKLATTDGPPLRPAPLLGQHSREILCGELGLRDDEYDSLVTAGITGTLGAERSTVSAPAG